jgi:sugar lactone lactonase YvrE
MNRKLVNVFLVLLAVAIIAIILFDFLRNKAGDRSENRFEYNIDELRHVDSTLIIYRQVGQFPVNAEKLSGIAVSGDEIVVIADHLVLKYDKTGSEKFRGQINFDPTALAPDSNGELWGCFPQQVFLFDAQGNLLKRSNSFGDHAVITSLAVSGERIYVADAGNRIVYQCDKQGNIVARIGEKNPGKGVSGFVIPSPYFDIAIDDSGFLWAANTGRHTFDNFNADGSLRTSWGKTSIKIDGFSGCCNPAHFCILSDNSFVTSEKGLVRIKLYDQHGQFKGVVAPPDQFGKQDTEAPDVAVDSDERIWALDFVKKQVRIFEKK